MTNNRVISHSKYNGNTVDYDYGLIRLDGKVDLENEFDRMAPACLPTKQVFIKFWWKKKRYLYYVQQRKLLDMWLIYKSG